MHRAVTAQDKKECGSGSSYGDGGGDKGDEDGEDDEDDD